MLALVATYRPDAPVEIRTVDEPSPGPDEALIEVRAFALNRGELTLLATRPDGWRPGQDIAGVVLRQAADGSGPAEGTRVVCLVDEAGWSQRVAVPVSRLGVLPESVGFARAAALPVAGLTALRALRVGGSLLGRRVLVTGASGGVGSLAVQLSALAGAHVAGIASNERREDVLRLGADEVFPDMDAAGGQFDLILESVGGSSLKNAIRLIAPDGTIVVFGNSSREQTSIGFADFAGHARATIFAFFVYESPHVELFGQDLAYLASLVEDGKLRPQVGLELGWQEIDRGIDALRNRQVAGKVVFTVD